MAVQYFKSRAVAESTNIPLAVYVINVRHQNRIFSYIRDASGTALVTGGSAKWSPADTVVTFFHWGAQFGSSYDNSTAVRLAIESGRKIVHSQEDIFYIKTPVVAETPNPVDIDGGTILVNIPSPTHVAIDIRNPTTNGGNFQRRLIRGLNIFTLNSLVQKGVRFTYPENRLAEQLGSNRHAPHVEMTECVIGPLNIENQNHRFTIANVQIFNKSHSHFTNCVFYGPKARINNQYFPYVNGTRGLLVSGSGEGGVNIRLNGTMMKHVERGVHLHGPTEGVQVVNCLMNAVGWGVHQAFVNPEHPAFETLGIFVRGTHINCVKYAIQINGAVEVFVTDCELYGKADKTNQLGFNWQAVRLGFDGGAIRYAHVKNNVFSGTGFSTVDNGVVLGDVSIAHITENQGNEINTIVNTNWLSGSGKREIYSRDNFYNHKNKTFIKGLTAQANDASRIFTSWSYE